MSNFREGKHPKNPSAASAFAPCIIELHDALDKSVLAAYEWEDLALRTDAGDEELLRLLLTMNFERSGDR